MIGSLPFLLYLCFPLAVTQGPSSGEYARAAILIDEGKFRSALAVYQALMKTPSPFIATRQSRVLNNMGYCCYSLGRYEEAYESFLKALAIDPDYFLCLNNISAVLIRQKKYAEALPHLQKALSLRPDYIKVLINLFVAYANLEDKESAIRYLKLAYQEDKDYTIKRFRMKNIRDKDMMKIINMLEAEDKNGARKNPP